MRKFASIVAGIALVFGILGPSRADEATEAAKLELSGSEHFRAGRFAESVADFDAEIKLDPRRSPWHWKRGISLYYLGRYADGAKQFEGYQTVDGNDVENAVWRFLCQARDPKVGLEKAQQQILPIKDDPRVPMMQVYGLYQGKLSPEEVMAATRTGDPSEEVLQDRLFYAHLYLGLYHEVRGDAAAAKKHIAEAELRKIRHYMWDVAAVHARMLNEPKASKKPEKKPAADKGENKPAKKEADEKEPAKLKDAGKKNSDPKQATETKLAPKK